MFRDKQKEWLKKMIDQAPGLIAVFAHAHMWPPNSMSQDNEAIEELIDILRGTYEVGIDHNQVNIFFNGGHHRSDCNRVDGIYFIDPIGALYKGYARVVIDIVNMKMDYIGRFKEESYVDLDLRVYPDTQKTVPLNPIKGQSDCNRK